ncbi:hypothetical protein DFJ63DRAFT_274275, partial [Scheffersomyces coipomensis]|uniref:uncharacterized protein n=1 Tax=Scheffersomyces coipomensis TaxID=1788519 RepID=UPI00315CACD0
MGIYQRYASREHDEAFFNSSKRDQSINNSTNVSQSIPKSTDLTSIDIPPLSGQYDAEHKDNSHITTINDYVRMFPSAAFYVGHDKELFEDVIVMVYNHLKTNKISTKALTKFGLTSYDNMKLDPNSRFWPSCENLSEQSQQSPVKRALAITNLKNYNRLSNHSGSIELNRSWDETNAGSLAESMILLENKTPEEVGLKLTQIGLLQSHQLDSVLLDIVYDNSDQRAINNNNRLVFLIGEQLEQLFDPLLEYSPEAMQIEYIVPTTANYAPTKVNSHLIDSVVTELITVQANFTMGLVNLLQNFIIPLRISVLSSTANTGIAKLNQVFPPTIDEITRINCILHDALSKAHSYGYMEVMKVMNMILPYFYKPFIRHEANLRNFSSKIDRFNKKNRSNVFENDSINQGGYSYRGVESIVSGSLMELPRFKLILKRLQETIRSEKVILGVNSESDEEAKLFQTYFSRSIEVIDAFGGEENQLSIDPRQRIFTPTGKILTELASKWPSELQYGWLSRKVVGIFKLKNVKSEGIHDIEILIIFSDHLLFITIVDNSYYLRDGSSKNLSIPDILMHSLINEKPLPNLSLFPDMQVTNWCDINDVLVTSYKAVGSDGTESDLLRFLSKHQNGFNSTNQEERKFSKNFEVINTKRSELHNSTSILKLINKARVLLKSQPFHLFRSDTPNLSLYSTAHDVSVYEAETCKSPIALFLNMKIKDTEVYFTDHPYLDLIIHANLVTDGLVRIKAVDKFGIFKSRSTCEIQDFQKVIKEFVGNFYACVFKSSNSISNHAIEATGQDIKYVLDTFMNSDIEKLKEELREKQDRVKPIPLIERKTHKKTLSEALSIPESYLTKKVTNVTTNVQPEEKKLTIEKKEMKEEPLSKTQKAKRRRSFVQTIFQAFKRKNTGKVSPDVSQVKENGYIPQGEKKEYKKIYKPNPEL